jgi:hypothetical protein
MLERFTVGGKAGVLQTLNTSRSRDGALMYKYNSSTGLQQSLFEISFIGFWKWVWDFCHQDTGLVRVLSYSWKKIRTKNK